MDPGVSSAEAFHRRSLDNFNNRCLHHHVFDEANSRELLTRCGKVLVSGFGAAFSYPFARAHSLEVLSRSRLAVRVGLFF